MYTIQNEFLKVTVAGKGAELMSIVAADGTEYVWQGDPKYWADRSPNIFPSVGRLTGGKYRLDGNYYELGCHGFAWLSNFEAWRAQDTSRRNHKNHFVDCSPLVPTVDEFLSLPFIHGNTIEQEFAHATFYASL